MPRKNNTPKHTVYAPASHEQSKTRYSNERTAQHAADEAMLLRPEVALSVYRGIDGGWYLTSRSK